MTNALPISVPLLAAAAIAFALPARHAAFIVTVLVACLAQAVFGLVPGPTHAAMFGGSLHLGGPAIGQIVVAFLVLAIAIANGDEMSRTRSAALALVAAGLSGALGVHHLLSWFAWIALALVGAQLLSPRPLLPWVGAFACGLGGAVVRSNAVGSFSLFAGEAVPSSSDFLDSIGREPSGFILGTDAGAVALFVGLVLLALVPLRPGRGASPHRFDVAWWGVALAGITLLAQAFVPSSPERLGWIGAGGLLAGLAFAMRARGARGILASGAAAAAGLATLVASTAGDRAAPSVLAAFGASLAALAALAFAMDAVARRAPAHRALVVSAYVAAVALGGAIPFVAQTALAAEASERLPRWLAWVPLAALVGLVALVGLRLAARVRECGRHESAPPGTGAGRRFDALPAALALGTAIAILVAGDLPAPGFEQVGGRGVLLGQLAVLGGVGAYRLGRRARRVGLQRRRRAVQATPGSAPTA